MQLPFHINKYTYTDTKKTISSVCEEIWVQSLSQVNVDYPVGMLIRRWCNCVMFLIAD